MASGDRSGHTGIRYQSDERELSLRLLRHQQYHDTDIVTVRVEGES